MEFKNLPEDVIVEYVTENLEDKSLVSALVEKLQEYHAMNFDCMVSVVDEVNAVGNIADAIDDMNLTNYGTEPNYEIVKVADETGTEYKFMNDNFFQPTRGDCLHVVIEEDHELYKVDRTTPMVKKGKSVIIKAIPDNQELPSVLVTLRKPFDLAF